MEPPLDEWEEQIGRIMAERLREQARDGLSRGAWSPEDLENVVEIAERRMTRPQRERLWETLTGDAELTRLASEAGR